MWRAASMRYALAVSAVEMLATTALCARAGGAASRNVEATSVQATTIRWRGYFMTASEQEGMVVHSLCQRRRSRCGERNHAIRVLLPHLKDAVYPERISALWARCFPFNRRALPRAG